MKKAFLFIIIFFIPNILNAHNYDFDLSKEEIFYLKNKKVIKINVEDSWRPYSFVENNEAKGFSIDLMKLIGEKLFIDIEFVKSDNWQRGIDSLKNKQIDIIPNIVNTKERQKYFSFSKESLFHVKNSFASYSNYKDISQLKNKKLGIVKGYYLEELIKEKYPKLEIISESSTDKLIVDLINKEIDAVIEDYVVLNSKLNSLALDFKIYNNLSLDDDFERPLYLAFSKDDKVLKSIFSKAMKFITKDEFSLLYKKWGIYFAENSNEVGFSAKEEDLLAKAKMNIYVTNWEPFTIHGNNSIEGICTDIWELIVKKSYIDYKYIKDANFAEALSLIKKDPNGMIIATAKTKDREEYGAFTKPFISFPIAVATNVDKDFIIDFKELEGKTVAVGKNYTAHVKLKKAYPGIRFVAVKDTIAALNLLANNKVYAATDILPALIYNMNKYNFSNLKVSGTSKLNFDVRFMVNKHNEDLIPILNKYIDSLSSEDKQKILNKWIYTKEVTKTDHTAVYIILALSLIVFLFMFYRQKVLKNKEEFIKNERYKYKSILDLASDSIHILDKNGNLVEYSKSFANMLEYKYDEVSKLNIKDWAIDYKNDEALLMIERYMQRKEAITFETRFKRKDETLIDVQISAIGIEIDEGKYLYASARDITEEKLNELLIAEQKQEFESIFNYSKDGIAILDKDTKILKFNDAFLELSGFERCDLFNKTTIDLTAPEDVEFTKELVKEIYKTGKAVTYEKSFITNNNRLTLNISLSLLPDKQRLLIVAKDVTSLKQMEDQSRLAAMGEMIGNIAHQWRQPLSVISTSASGIKFKLEFSEKLEKNELITSAEKIVSQAKYLSKTIDDFRDFIKNDKNLIDIEVDEVINASLSLVEAVLKNNYIKVQSDMDKDFVISGNKNELQQAFINILNNAKDIICERVEDENNRYIFISTKKIDDKLELKILDNAGGIDESIIKRIFEPYFTTKHKSVGTGLGLSMVDKIIRQRHNFDMEVHNEEFSYEDKKYKGAAFVITFTKA